MSTTKDIEIGSPLYLHPSDGSNFVVVEKLQGSSNYRPWKRSFEIALASKRKLGFVTGAVERDKTDKVKQEAWDTCNSMVISWILLNVSDAIRKSVMYSNSAKQIWKQLQQRYQVVSGARKYQLNKQVYETKQVGKSVTEYFTDLCTLWEELENLDDMPPITTWSEEITAYVGALHKKQEEQKLFQFLNGLDETFSAQRSNLLMRSPLPTTEEACCVIQQEESQREVLKPVKEEAEASAMMSKGSYLSCTVCGKSGHAENDCWSVKGMPPSCGVCGKFGHLTKDCWNVKGFPGSSNKGKGKETSYNTRGGRAQRVGRGGRSRGGGRFAGNAQTQKDK